MKKLIFLLIPIFGISQVGINTTTPTATLDVNGTGRIRDLPAGALTDFIITVDASGNLRKLPVSALVQSACPLFLRSESNSYYLKFSSTSSIQNPNSPVIVNGVSWAFAGTFNQNNIYYYSYTNTSGIGLNINNPFSVSFGTQTCYY